MPTVFSRRKFLTGAGAAALGLIAPHGLLIEHKNAKIKIVFHFGGHETEHDAMQMAPVLREFKPHVFCTEAAFATEEQAFKLEENAYRGIRRPKTEIPRELEFNWAEGNVLEAHGSPRIYYLERFDKEEGKILEKEANDAMAAQKEANRHFLYGNPEFAMHLYKQADIKMRENDRMRERMIKKVFASFYDRLTERYPVLKKEPEIRVVVRYGAAHVPLFEHAIESNIGRVKKTSADVSKKVLRYIREKQSRGTIANLIFLDHVVGYALELGVNHTNARSFVEKIPEIDVEKFKRISSAVGEKILAYGLHWTEAFQKALGEEGISLPTSKQGIPAFIEKHGGKIVSE